MTRLWTQLVSHFMNPFVVPKSYLSLAYSYMLPSYFVGKKQSSPVANMSLLTLLSLMHVHGTYEDQQWNLRYRLMDIITAVDDERRDDISSTAKMSISWDQLYRCLTERSDEEALWLLIYFLMHDSKPFMTYMIQQKDLSVFVTSALRHLYERVRLDEAHLDFGHILLSIILMLSRDELFNDRARTMVRNNGFM